MKVHWKFLAESRLKMPLKKFFERERVTTYEEAVEALGRFRQPVGTAEEVAPYLPAPTHKNTTNSDSSTAPPSGSSRRTQEILSRTKKEAPPKSPAEAAADAITKSNAVKSPKGSQKKKSTRKSKTK